MSNAVKVYFGISYELSVYEEHAISKGSSSRAASYVGIIKDGKMFWGVGIDEDIIKSSIAALVRAANKLAKSERVTEGREEQIVDIMNYIQNHYKDATPESLAEQFGLSKSELARYIRDKSGMTFQEALKKARLKKARRLLKETDLEADAIAQEVGFESAELFGRLFKKEYGMTPAQLRGQR